MKKQKDNSNPLVSIIIPVYNGEKYLNFAIDSAIAQTYKNTEVIVIDDGSTDSTEKICREYGKKIKYIKKENGGVASALNLGITESRGDYISWLSHDDVYDENKIQLEIDALGNNPMNIISCRYDYVNSKGEFIYKNAINKEIENDKCAYKHLFNYEINGCALLINKKHFDINGLFNEKLLTTQDFDMWFRLFKNNQITFVEEVLLHSRVHELQGSKILLSSHLEECDALWINFIKSLSAEEKKNIYGSEYNFFETLLKTLKKYVNYPNVFEFLEISKVSAIINDEKLFESYLKNEYNIHDDDIIKKIKKPKKKPRIVIGCFGIWEDRGGLNRVVANIANGLADKFEIFILTYGEIEKGYSLVDKVKLIPINIWKTKGDIAFNIAKFLKLINTDIYINPYNCEQVFIEAMKNAKKFNIKVISWNHEYYFLPYHNSAFYKTLSERNNVLKELDLVMWLTSASKIYYDQFGKNSIVMHNALTLNKELIKSDYTDDSIVSIARFDDPRKGLEHLIILAKVLKEKGINTKIKLYGNYDLDLIGGINHKTMRELIKEYNLDDRNIQFMGFVKDIESVLKHSKLNILLSSHEGFGLTLIEAASFGIPTLAYNDSGFEDIIVDGENGYLFERYDFEAIAEKIRLIYNDNTIFERLSENCQKRINQFSYDTIISRWTDILNMLLYNPEQLETYTESNFDKNFENMILGNGIKELESAFLKLLNNSENKTINKEENHFINKEEQKNKSHIRKLYRKLPLKIRINIKNKIIKGDSFAYKFLKNRIKFDN